MWGRVNRNGGAGPTDYVNVEANVLIMLASTRSCDLLFDVCRCRSRCRCRCSRRCLAALMPARYCCCRLPRATLRSWLGPTDTVNTNVDLIPSQAQQPVMARMQDMTKPNSKTAQQTHHHPPLSPLPNPPVLRSGCLMNVSGFTIAGSQ